MLCHAVAGCASAVVATVGTGGSIARVQKIIAQNGARDEYT